MTITTGIIAMALATTACTGPGDGDSEATADVPEEAASTGTAPADQVSAILVQPIHEAQAVLASDDLEHVEYELLVVNVFSDPVTLTGVTVIGPDGAELQTIEGGVLAAGTQALYTKAASPVVEPSAAVSVDVDLALEPGTVPDRLWHRIEYTLPEDAPGAVIVDDLVVHGPEVTVDRSDAIVIQPPVAGDGWLATSACCDPNVHRDLRLAIDGLRLETAETFAVDWARIRDERLFDGDGSTNEQYYTYGEDLLAVADGTVVVINEGVADSIPGVGTSPEAKSGFGGNYVILELEPGVYAAYAHMQSSIEVELGDAVEAGEVLGKLGNTGPSLGPHLHFAILDRPDLFAARSLPFVLDEFTMAGTLDFDASTDEKLAITPEARELREAYPLWGTISDFTDR